MDRVSRLIKRHEPLLRYIVKKYLERLVNDDRSAYRFDDLLQEARIAAWRAVMSHDENKRSKVSTYMGTCATNKMRDLVRKVNRLKNPSYTPIEDIHLEKVDESIEQQYDLKNMSVTLEKFLETDHYKYIEKIINEDFTLDEILKYAMGLHGSDPDDGRRHRRKCRDEVVSCLSQVQQALELSAKSLTSRSTKQRAL